MINSLNFGSPYKRSLTKSDSESNKIYLVITWLEPIETLPDSPVKESVDAIQCQSLSEESCDRIASLVAEKVLSETRKGHVDEEETAFRSKVA